MEKLIELNTENILISSTIIKKQKPDFIYVPILRNSTILVKQNSEVTIGSPIIKSENILTSSISGRVTSIKKINTIEGVYDAIEIMNNFKEKSLVEEGSKRSLNKISKEELNKALSFFSIDLNEKKNLILNAIDDEPYVLTNNFYLFNDQIDFLELLDKLAKTYKIEKTIIAVKSISSNNINLLMDKLGMYPSISLSVLPNLYLLGKKEFLINHLNLDQKDTVVINTEEFYHLNNYIKKKQLISHKFLTISGNNVKNPSIVKTKIGTKLTEILEDFEIKEGSIFIANGLMQGKRIITKDFIITSDINSILIMKETPKKKSEKCLNCGACIDICPVGLNPILHKNKKQSNSKCLECGLCSYICPSYIEFNVKRGE